MKKISVILLALICVPLTLSGCSGNERLTNMTIVQAVGIDYNNGEYSLTLQYLDIDKGTGTNEGVQGNITDLVKSSGETIDKALNNAEKTLPDKLFYGQNKLIVIGSSVDGKSNGELISFLTDTLKCRPDILIVKSKSSAKEIVENEQRGKRVPAENICKQLMREKCTFTVNDYLNDLKENNLPVIEARGDYTVVIKGNS